MGREVKWISGAAARSHMMLLASDGSVWGCGNNVFGQLGLVSKWELSMVRGQLTRVASHP